MWTWKPFESNEHTEKLKTAKMSYHCHIKWTLFIFHFIINCHLSFLELLRLLTLSMLGKHFSRWYLEIFFLLCPEKSIWHSIAHHLLRSQFWWNVKAYILEKKKNITNLLRAATKVNKSNITLYFINNIRYNKNGASHCTLHMLLYKMKVNRWQQCRDGIWM